MPNGIQNGESCTKEWIFTILLHFIHLLHVRTCFDCPRNDIFMYFSSILSFSLSLLAVQSHFISREPEPRRALSLYDNVPLRTRRVLLLYKVYGNSAFLVLNGTLLNSVNVHSSSQPTMLCTLALILFEVCSHSLSVSLSFSWYLRKCVHTFCANSQCVWNSHVCALSVYKCHKCVHTPPL